MTPFNTPGQITSTSGVMAMTVRHASVGRRRGRGGPHPRTPGRDRAAAGDPVGAARLADQPACTDRGPPPRHRRRSLPSWRLQASRRTDSIATWTGCARGSVLRGPASLQREGHRPLRRRLRSPSLALPCRMFCRLLYPTRLHGWVRSWIAAKAAIEGKKVRWSEAQILRHAGPQADTSRSPRRRFAMQYAAKRIGRMPSCRGSSGRRWRSTSSSAACGLDRDRLIRVRDEAVRPCKG